MTMSSSFMSTVRAFEVSVADVSGLSLIAVVMVLSLMFDTLMFEAQGAQRAMFSRVEAAFTCSA
jgi:hypothetical protein